MRVGYIYAVTCTCHPEEGIRYIGQTVVSVSSRRCVHLWNSRTPSSKSYGSHFSNWIRKHGEKNIRFFVVEETTSDEIDAREDWWIRDLLSKGARLTNVKGGGGQARGHKRPDISERMSGTRNPMYGTNRAELMAYARSFQSPPSEETKAIWSENRRGEGNSRAILKESDVRHLRETYTGAYGELSRLAREYGISAQSMYLMLNRKTWKHVE